MGVSWSYKMRSPGSWLTGNTIHVDGGENIGG
jgi:hypothetical protein